jgi:hypothetical protein
MASTSGPLGTPASARVILTPEIISITGNTARIKLGDDYWEVSLLEILPDASTKKMDVTTDLAAEVKTAVLRLQDEGVFDIKTTKKVVFDTDDKMEIQRIYHSAREVTDVGEMTAVEKTDAKIARLAPDVLTKLGSTICVARDKWRSAHPHEIGGTASPTRTAASTAAAPRTVKVSPAQQLFDRRTASAIGSTNIAECLADQIEHLDPSLHGAYASKPRAEIATDIRTKTSDKLKDPAAKYDEGAKFQAIHADLQAIAADTTARAALLVQAEGLKTPRSITHWTGTHVFGDTNRQPAALALIQKPIASLTPDEKKKLVQLYAAYCSQPTAMAGKGFLLAFNEAIPGRNVVILTHNTDGTITGLPPSCDPSSTLFMRSDGFGKYSSYSRGALTAVTTGPEESDRDPVEPLNTLTSLPAEKTITITPPAPRPTPSPVLDPRTTGHKDLGAGGLCADLCLVDQLKAVDSSCTLTQADLRTRAATVIASTDFDPYVSLIHEDLRAAQQDARRASATRDDGLVDAGGKTAADIRAILAKDFSALSPSERKDLKAYYAARLGAASSNVWFDSAAFSAMSLPTFDRTGFPARFSGQPLQIAILRDADAPTTPGQLTMTHVYPDDVPLSKDHCLFLWYNKTDHYHSMIRDHALLDAAITANKATHVREFLTTPTNQKFIELKQRFPEVYQRICTTIREQDHRNWTTSHYGSEPRDPIEDSWKDHQFALTDASGGTTTHTLRSLGIDSYGAWRLLANRPNATTTPNDSALIGAFLRDYGITDASLSALIT